MYIIGVISYIEDTIDEVRGIEDELNQRGYAVHLEQMGFNNQSPKIGDFYYQEEAVILWLCRCFGEVERCKIAIKAFIETDVDVIVAMTQKALDIALLTMEDSGIPIIFTHVTRESGTELELERLQKIGKVTGVWDVWLETAEARLSLLSEVVPPTTKVHAVYNPDLPAVRAEAKILRKAAQNLNLELIPYKARNLHEVKKEIASLHTSQDHAIFRLADPTTSQAASFMGAIAHEKNIPYMGVTIDELERCGSLFALEAEGTGNLVANMIDRILGGEAPSNISLEEPIKKILAVNLQVAKELRLIVSPAVLSKAKIKVPAQESTHLGSQIISILIAYLFSLSLIIIFAERFPFPYLIGLIGVDTSFLAIGLWLLLNRRVFIPIRELAIAAEKIGSGELNTPINILSQNSDEVDTLARSLVRMKNNLITSYAEQEQLNRNLKLRIDELTEADKALREAKAELELANSRIIEADNNSRFLLTTYIHDEILGPLDELSTIASYEGKSDIISITYELEKRVRRLRYDLSVPILKDIGIELRRLVQETLPQIYMDTPRVQLSLDLSAFNNSPELEPGIGFLAYRFIRGAVSNVYRHAMASKIIVEAVKKDRRIIIRVTDDGKGFELSEIDQYVKNGHYFFHDIQIRVKQLRGTFEIDSHIGKGTSMEITIPVRRIKKSQG
jgi:signal transduction histidine kinase/ABC-type uncharacterized transport system substrate-binding protein